MDSQHQKTKKGLLYLGLPKPISETIIVAKEIVLSLLILTNQGRVHATQITRLFIMVKGQKEYLGTPTTSTVQRAQRLSFPFKCYFFKLLRKLKHCHSFPISPLKKGPKSYPVNTLSSQVKHL